MSTTNSDNIVEEKHTHSPSINHIERQQTLHLSADQCERLFLTSSARKCDTTKAYGDPTLLGLLGFLVPFSSTVFSLLHFQGSSPLSLVSISGSCYFVGGIAMVLAGIGEFIIGNTFPFVVFVIYGGHWMAVGYTTDPLHGIIASYGADGALNQAFNAGQGNYFVVLALVSFIFFLGSLRTNVPFVVVFMGLVIVFSIFGAADYQLGFNPTSAGLERAAHYLKIAGAFGFVTMMSGWYLAIINVCASTAVPCPLPTFDLSKRFVHKDFQNCRHRETVRESK